MSLILCIETATKCCSVALAKEGQLFAFKEDVPEVYFHSESLNIFIQDLLNDHQHCVHDLDAIAISSGPGSYTGLRIGCSTAKGLCYALNLPLISIPSLESMAQLKRSHNSDKILCPMIDARRMEVYYSLFYKKFQTDVQAKVIDENSFEEELKNNSILFYGDGADKCQSFLTHPNAYFDLGFYASARGMVALSQEKYDLHMFEDIAYFTPFYLKEFTASVKS